MNRRNFCGLGLTGLLLQPLMAERYLEVFVESHCDSEAWIDIKNIVTTSVGENSRMMKIKGDYDANSFKGAEALLEFRYNPELQSSRQRIASPFPGATKIVLTITKGGKLVIEYGK